MEITRKMYDTIIARINTLIKNKKHYKGDDANDVFHNIYEDHQHDSLKQWIALIPKYISRGRTSGNISNWSEEKLKRKKLFCYDWLKNEIATNEAYHTLCNKRNADWERRQRAGNDEWRTDRNAKKRLKNVEYKLKRFSKCALRCTLPKYKCFRQQQKRQMNDNNICPLPKLFVREDKMCHPI